MDGQRLIGKCAQVAFALLALAGLLLTRLYSYVLFHTLAEMVSVVVATGVFVLAWNARRHIDNNALHFLGIGCLFVGLLALLHALAWKSLGVFHPDWGANLPTQLWIADRALMAATMVLAPVFLGRRIYPWLTFAIYTAVTALLLTLIFHGVFPDCLLEGQGGLTPFKKSAEYVISGVFAIALVLYFRKRDRFDRRVFRFVMGAIALNIAAEMVFTLYAKVDDRWNQLGHLFQLGSFFLLYKALIETGLVQPLNLLVRELKQSEEALRKERQRLFSVLDMLPGCIYLQDDKYKIAFANRTFRRGFGEPAGRPCYQIMYGRSAPCDPCPTREAFASNKAQHWERTTPDGRTYVMYDNPFTDVDGTSLMLKMAVDITDRKHAEEALRESRRELMVRNQIAHVFLTVSDEKMYGEVLALILEALESRHGIFGYLDEEGNLVCPSLTREIWRECAMPEKDVVFPRNVWMGIWGAALTEKRTFCSRGPFHVPKGHIAIERALAVPIVHHDESIGHIVVANKAADYTEHDQQVLESIAGHIAPVLAARLGRDRQDRERKRAEEALRASVDFQQRLLSTAATAIFILDGQRRVTSVNEEFCRITGYGKEELEGQTCDLFCPNSGRGMCRFATISRRDPVWKTQSRVLTRFGEELTVIKNADVLVDGTGQVTGWIESFVDVTALVKAREAAEAASRAKSAFLANMSHELRTPLTAIIGFTQYLKRDGAGELNDEQKECLRDIYESGQHLLSLISDLLDLARVEAGKLEVNIKPLALEPEVDWALMLMRKKAEQQRVNLRLNIPEDLPAIAADQRAVRQILINLLSNAVKFSPGGGNVEVNAFPYGGFVAIEVTDTGIGIAPGELDRIFGAFHRTEDTQKRSIEGTGLGLALVRGLVTAMGGAVTVESQLGKGSRFTFTLPRAPLDAVASEEDSGRSQESGVRSQE
jgi:PAS domain S-box-containing protein